MNGVQNLGESMPPRTARKEPAPAAGGGPRSLARVLGLFEAVANSGDGLTLAALSVALSAPKSSLLMLLRPLAQSGYLVHEGGRYRLGAAAFRLASTIQATRSLPRLMRPFIERLVAATGESAYLAVIDPDQGMGEYVDGVESPHAVRYWVPVGTRRNLYSGAAGKMLLAHQPEPWRERYLRNIVLKPVAAHTVTSKTALRRELESIRRVGCSISRGEAVDGAAGIAAPVFTQDGRIAAALLLCAPLERFDRELPGYRRALLDVAARASKPAP
jgi:DNA-binding IclR family transcriptional regulator